MPLYFLNGQDFRQEGRIYKKQKQRNVFFSVFIDLCASFKLALRGDNKVTLDVHRHLIFMAFLRHELCLIKAPSCAWELLIMNGSAWKRNPT